MIADDLHPEDARAFAAAQKEVLALLAVARAARRFHTYVNDYSDPIDDADGPLRRALARLDKTIGGKP
jgi:hypothetical protein